MCRRYPAGHLATKSEGNSRRIVTVSVTIRRKFEIVGRQPFQKRAITDWLAVASSVPSSANMWTSP